VDGCALWGLGASASGLKEIDWRGEGFRPACNLCFAENNLEICRRFRNRVPPSIILPDVFAQAANPEPGITDFKLQEQLCGGQLVVKVKGR